MKKFVALLLMAVLLLPVLSLPCWAENDVKLESTAVLGEILPGVLPDSSVEQVRAAVANFPERPESSYEEYEGVQYEEYQIEEREPLLSIEGIPFHVITFEFRNDKLQAITLLCRRKTPDDALAQKLDELLGERRKYILANGWNWRYPAVAVGEDYAVVDAVYSSEFEEQQARTYITINYGSEWQILDADLSALAETGALFPDVKKGSTVEEVIAAGIALPDAPETVQTVDGVEQEEYLYQVESDTNISARLVPGNQCRSVYFRFDGGKLAAIRLIALHNGAGKGMEEELAEAFGQPEKSETTEDKIRTVIQSWNVEGPDGNIALNLSYKIEGGEMGLRELLIQY